MSYFTPTTVPVDPLNRHESAEIVRAREELVREPYVTNERNAAWVGDHIASVVENPAPLWWWIATGIAAFVASFTAIGILYLIVTGVGVWGENNSANWAWDITNFVFWIGIGHAGTMIAAVLYLTRQKWATGINRAAETMTVFAVMCAGIYPAVHVGRVWFAWYLAPIPNGNAIWPNFRSPLLWDVFAVSTYLSVSIMFWYVGLIPDVAAMRDRIKNKILKYFYAVVCLGWRGSARQWAHYEFCYLMLAGVATLRDIITLRHIDMCCRFVLLMALLISYIYLMEFFIAYYGGSPNERFTFYRDRIFGPYGTTWLCMIIFNSVIPMLFWSKKIRRNPWLAFGIVIFPRIGMWLVRVVILGSSVQRYFR